jgi:predicted Fe-Mo cluster-binding NifX family protein
MKVCIPTMDDRGLEGLPSDHFGSAPFFTFIDTDSGEVEAVRNGGANHVHGSCRPLEFLGTRPVDAVVCRGIGRGALSKLQNGGLQVFITLEMSVEKTLGALKEGRLRQMTSDEACQGHSHGSSPAGRGGHGAGLPLPEHQGGRSVSVGRTLGSFQG